MVCHHLPSFTGPHPKVAGVTCGFMAQQLLDKRCVFPIADDKQENSPNLHQLLQVWQLCGWLVLPGCVGFYCNCCIIRGRGSAHPLLGDFGASQLQNWHQVWAPGFRGVFHQRHGVAFRIKMLVEQS